MSRAPDRRAEIAGFLRSQKHIWALRVAGVVAVLYALGSWRADAPTFVADLLFMLVVMYLWVFALFLAGDWLRHVLRSSTRT